MQIEKNKESSEKNKVDIDKNHALIKSLEDKSVEMENDLSELKYDTEAVRMNLCLANNRVKTNKEKIEAM